MTTAAALRKDPAESLVVKQSDPEKMKTERTVRQTSETEIKAFVLEIQSRKGNKGFNSHSLSAVRSLWGLMESSEEEEQDL